MPKLKQHEAVGEEYLAGAGTQPQASHRFPYPAPVVWNALLDAKAWTEWLPLTKVEWTSPKPFGVGTTRTVHAGSRVIEETFFAWEEGRRMAFRFERSNLPVSAGVEDYQVVDADGGCELRWWFRCSAVFPLNLLLRFQLPAGLRKGMPKLEELIRSDPKRFGA